MRENNKNIEELKINLKFMRQTAHYNIFALQSLQKYCGTILQRKIPYELLGLQLLDGKTKKFNSFLDENGANVIGHQKLLHIKRSAEAFITRNWIKETFRLVESYCKDHDLLDEMEKKDWHDFIRPYINAWSHGGVLELKKQSKKIQMRLKKGPIIYRGHELKWEMDGKAASLKKQIAYEICEDIISFVDSL